MSLPPHLEEEPLEAIRWRDELLQALYWLRGEGFGHEVTPAGLVSFLQQSEGVIGSGLEKLAAEGYLEALVDADGQECYGLTSLGLEEGRRRFVDEFAPLLGRHGHGECNQPECACHQAVSADETCWAQEAGSGQPSHG